MIIYNRPLVIYKDDNNYCFNGGIIPDKDTLIGIKKLIENTLLLSNDEIKKNNKEINDYWKKKDNHLIKNNKKIVSSGYIYIYKQEDFYKIGKSKRLDCRNIKYITENPKQIELVFKAFVNDYDGAEIELHKLFKDSHHNREWFCLNKNNIKFIKDITLSEFGKKYINEILANKFNL